MKKVNAKLVKPTIIEAYESGGNWEDDILCSLRCMYCSAIDRVGFNGLDVCN